MNIFSRLIKKKPNSIINWQTKQRIKEFNKKYNAGHWNDLGAFYGCNNILTKMQTWYPQLLINEKSEYNIKTNY